MEANVFALSDGKEVDYGAVTGWFLNKWPITGKLKNLNEYKTPDEVARHLQDILVEFINKY